MNAVVQTPATPDYIVIKSRQHRAWSSGDYGRIGITLQIIGETLAERMDTAPGSRVLDVAAGNGNATLAFARRWCDVVSTDYVDTLLDQGRLRAEAENLPVSHQLADAEALPFRDGEFDAVVSTFGVMFAPNQAAAAAEMVRVCRPGGRIGMTNWTAPGFIGQLFGAIGRHVAPPAGLHSPARWGDDAWLHATFGAKAASIRVERRDFMFRYPSPAHFVEFFRTFYGPVHMAFRALDEAGRAALERDILETVARFDTATDGSMRVPSEYAEVIVEKA